MSFINGSGRVTTILMLFILFLFGKKKIQTFFDNLFFENKFLTVAVFHSFESHWRCFCFWIRVHLRWQIRYDSENTHVCTEALTASFSVSYLEEIRCRSTPAQFHIFGDELCHPVFRPCPTRINLSLCGLTLKYCVVQEFKHTDYTWDCQQQDALKLPEWPQSAEWTSKNRNVIWPLAPEAE